MRDWDESRPDGLIDAHRRIGPGDGVADDDVSGHGIEAALFSVTLMNMLKTQTFSQQCDIHVIHAEVSLRRTVGNIENFFIRYFLRRQFSLQSPASHCYCINMQRYPSLLKIKKIQHTLRICRKFIEVKTT